MSVTALRPACVVLLMETECSRDYRKGRAKLGSAGAGAGAIYARAVDLDMLHLELL